ncbi:MAG: hypothetical protein KC613_13010 [Myxococcales bacterium]|nr:hypothetical protein [Myxococcales bacterium]MCB9522379.1 hypothetical protein [Myxococcales bacterium]
MRRVLVPLVAASMWLAGCEEGPDQIFTPNTGDPAQQNGQTPGEPFFQDGNQDYTSTAGTNDNEGRARFCSESQNTRVVERLVQMPIVPDVEMGGVPMRNPDGTPIHADQLVGNPIWDGETLITGEAMIEQGGGLCDPTVYLNALTWGPTNEVVAFINEDTKLLEAMLATQDYLGDMNGSYTKTNEDGSTEQVSMLVSLRERVRLGDVELDEYTSQANQGSRPRAWLNHANVNAIYRAVRETWFGAESIDPAYDCVASKVCALIYQTEEAQEVRQITLLYIIDSGVILVFSPEGEIIQLQIEPVRVAPFETAVEFDFGPDAETVAPTLASAAVPGCEIKLGTGMTWADFKRACVQEGDTTTLDRVDYSVFTQRNGVVASFNGVDLSFTRRVSERGVLRDGERPNDADELTSMTFTRTLNAPVAEFVPSELALAYKARLEARLRAAVTLPAEGAGGDPENPGDPGMDPVDPENPGDPGMDPVDPENPGDPGEPAHPFLAYELTIPPDLADAPSPIEQLFYSDAQGNQLNWNNTVIQEIRDLYDSLTPAQKAMVDPQVIEPTWIIEPYVDAVLDTFSHGQSRTRDATKQFRNTDDRRWVIGYANFIQNNVPYRVTVQYSLNYGAVTAVTIGGGWGEIDEILQGWNQALRPNRGLVDPPYPYYSADLALNPANPFGLNGQGITVLGYDRQLGTLDVELQKNTPNGPQLVELTVSGEPIEDRNGYLRQIRGERYEFVPANQVSLSGLETGMLTYVEADGQIGRVGMGGFKQPMTLCPGLRVSYGDDLPRKIQAWVDEGGVDRYRECEIVFNYSDNGNVLDSVASLTNRIAFVTVNKRAVQVDVWR